MSYLMAAVQVLYQRVLRAILRWRLRRHGTDPDAIPEIQELHRRRAAGESVEPDEPAQNNLP